MSIGKNVAKRDGLANVLGYPAYTLDKAPACALAVKIKRSPHPFAEILEVDCSAARGLAGVEAVYTYRDVPKARFTRAGQSFPELAPYDSLILDRWVRYVGDAVAIVAAEDEKTADKAISLIKVRYKKLPPVLNFETAELQQPVHPEADISFHASLGERFEHNIICDFERTTGDIKTVLQDCEILIDETYHTQAQAHVTMETHRAVSYMDREGKIVVVSSTQIPFHLKRIVSRALEIPASRVRVKKPSVGGGFGAKQTACLEVYPAFVTLKTGKSAYIVYDRRESFTSTTTRHEMRIRVRLGGERNGHIRAISLEVLSNAGAYAEHSSTTIRHVANKTLPLYSKYIEAQQAIAKAVYTNLTPAGAFRGYGATQGTFAVECAVNQFAHEIGMDPTEVRLINLIETGQTSDFLDRSPGAPPAAVTSINLKECIRRGKQLIGWDEHYGKEQRQQNGRLRAVGMAVSMQSSGVAGVDNANAIIQLEEGGSYSLLHGAADMGTGCDTVLAQMAAQVLKVSVEQISVAPIDTDFSPYDSGSYSSSTTTITGGAVVAAAKNLVCKICGAAAEYFGEGKEPIVFGGKWVRCGKRYLSLKELCIYTQRHPKWGQLTGYGSFGMDISPAPFVAGFAEIEIDTETGYIFPVRYVGIIDCGTVVNPALATVQAEGGFAQGIGMALYEAVKYDSNGRLITDSLMRYGIPTRCDIGEICVEFAPGQEPNTPFGVKSIGEVVCSTPCPAIQNAIQNAVGLHLTDLPMTPEKVFTAICKRGPASWSC